MAAELATRPEVLMTSGLGTDTRGGPWTDLNPCPIARCHPEAPWMGEEALRLYVDAEQSPTVIWLSGSLNRSTAVNLLPVVRELIGDGASHFELQTHLLSVPDEAGVDSLAAIQRIVQRSGGRCTWDGTTMTAPSTLV